MTDLFDDVERAAVRGDQALSREADLAIRDRTDAATAVNPDVYDAYEMEKAGYGTKNPQVLPNKHTNPGSRIIDGYDMSSNQPVGNDDRQDIAALRQAANEKLSQSTYTDAGLDEQGLDGLAMSMAAQIADGATDVNQAVAQIGETGATQEQQINAWNRAAQVKQEKSRQQADGLPASLQQLPQDRNYLAAVTLIEQALGNDPSKMSAQELVDRGLVLADAFKSSNVSMNPAGASLARLTMALRDEPSALAMLYLLDVDDKLPMTWSDAGRHTANILTDPTTYISFGAGKAAIQKTAGSSMKQVLLSRAMRGAGAGAGIGAAYASLYDAATQNIEKTGGVIDDYDALRNVAMAGVGAAAGGTVGGAGGVVFSPEIAGKLIERIRKNASIPRTPWAAERGSVGIPSSASETIEWKSVTREAFSALPDGNIKTARIAQIVKELEKSGKVSKKDMDWKGIDRLIAGRDKVSKQELMSYLDEQFIRPYRYVHKKSDQPGARPQEEYDQFIDDWTENYYRNTPQEVIDDIDLGPDQLLDMADDAWQDVQGDSTQYSTLVMPGTTDNYGEHLLITSQAGEVGEEYWKRNLGELYRESQHWGSEIRSDSSDSIAGVIGFSRWTDRKLASGDDTRVIEELQSDWATDENLIDLPMTRWMMQPTKKDLSRITPTGVDYPEGDSSHPYNAWLQDEIKRATDQGIDAITEKLPPSNSSTKEFHEFMFDRYLKEAPGAYEKAQRQEFKRFLSSFQRLSREEQKLFPETWERFKQISLYEVDAEMQTFPGYKSNAFETASPYQQDWPTMVLQDAIDDAIVDGKSHVAIPTLDSVAWTEGFRQNQAEQSSGARGTLNQYKKKILPKLNRWLKSVNAEVSGDYVQAPRELGQVRDELRVAFNVATDAVLNSEHPRLTRESIRENLIADVINHPEEYGITPFTAEEAEWLISNIRLAGVSMRRAWDKLSNHSFHEIPVTKIKLTDDLKSKIKSGKMMPAAAAAPLAGEDNDTE